MESMDNVIGPEFRPWNSENSDLYLGVDLKLGTPQKNTNQHV